MKIGTKVCQKGLISAIILSVLYFLGVILYEYFTAGKTLGSLFHSSSSRWLMVLLFVSLSPFSEEILFRGFFLTKLRTHMSFWKANMLIAMLFVLIHWPYWQWSGGFQVMVVRDSVSILILALLLGYLVKITNSLWPSVVVHMMNNVLSSFLQV
ncbi:MAG: hypothetical protein A2Z14_05185 [Chloroflexi bacterium RBG_16_48_8]|nr:MAG: hypothetical protein A2Z14_05185 [Chloroflexi bacterium RBG_16_48_8]